MFKNKLMFVVKLCYIIGLPAISHMNTFLESCPGRGSWGRLRMVQAIRDSLSGENLRAKVKPLVNLLFINTICPKSQRMSVIKYSSSPETLIPSVLPFLYYCFSFNRIGSFYIFSVFNEPWTFSFITNQYPSRASKVAVVVNNPPANAEDIKRWGFDLWIGKIPGKGNGNLLQYPCLGIPMDRRAWRASPWGCRVCHTQSVTAQHNILLYYKFCICLSRHHLLTQSHAFD